MPINPLCPDVTFIPITMKTIHVTPILLIDLQRPYHNTEHQPMLSTCFRTIKNSFTMCLNGNSTNKCSQGVNAQEGVDKKQKAVLAKGLSFCVVCTPFAG